MKKLVFALVIASLHMSSAYAASAGEALERAGEEIGAGVKGSHEDTIQPGRNTGAKLTTKGVANDNTSYAAPKPLPANDNMPKVQQATGFDSHVTCPADSAIRQLNARQQDAIFKAGAKKIAAFGCLENFQDPATAKEVASMDEAANEKADQLGVVDASKASEAQDLQILAAEEAKLAADMNISVAEAKDRMVALCDNTCDVSDREVMCPLLKK